MVCSSSPLIYTNIYEKKLKLHEKRLISAFVALGSLCAWYKNRKSIMNYPIPVEVIEQFRVMKKQSGKTIVRIIADALHFALKEENRKKWF
jgi:hypothetical protein